MSDAGEQLHKPIEKATTEVRQHFARPSFEDYILAPQPALPKPEKVTSESGHKVGSSALHKLEIHDPEKNAAVEKPVRPDHIERAASDTPAQKFELHGLKNGSGQHSSADAVVRVPENFDPTKPIHLMVYNHGFGSTASSAFKEAELDKQLKDAPPNTVLVVPEWQLNPSSRTSNEGRFAEAGRFKNLVNEAFSHTPGLEGKTLQNVDSIGLIGHSAGYKGVETELYKNGLANKVNSVTMLDAMYDPQGLDPWLRSNIHELAAGTKHFYNVSNDTFPASRDQAHRVQGMLREAGLPESTMYQEFGNGKAVMNDGQVQKHSIVFKFSSATTEGKGTHMSIPNLYVHQIVDARVIRKPINQNDETKL